MHRACHAPNLRDRPAQRLPLSVIEPAVHRGLGVIAALLGCSCLAALWSMCALFFPGSAPWLAPIVGALLALWLVYIGFGAGWLRALAAGILFVIAVLYAGYMEASANIAAQLGLGLAQGLQRVGPEMAYAWLSARWHAMDVALYLMGLLSAGALGLGMGAGMGRVRQKGSRKR